MRKWMVLLIAALMAGCTTGPNDDSPQTQTDPGSTVPDAEIGESASPDQDGRHGQAGQGGQGGQGGTGNGTDSGGDGGDGGDAGGAPTAGCDGDVQEDTLWTLPLDYDRLGDNGSELVDWPASDAKFRAAWSSQVGTYTVQVFDGETLVWETGASNGTQVGSGSSGQSGGRYVAGQLRVVWETEGTVDGLRIEAEYRAC